MMDLEDGLAVVMKLNDARDLVRKALEIAVLDSKTEKALYIALKALDDAKETAETETAPF